MYNNGIKIDIMEILALLFVITAIKIKMMVKIKNNIENHKVEEDKE